MNPKRLRFLARRHRVGLPSHKCQTLGSGPCDAGLLAAEVARLRAWADFAYDLLDAHIWGFSAGDWQAGEALAHALVGDDHPPVWQRDPDDPARIVVDPALWPVVLGTPSRLTPGEPSGRPGLHSKGDRARPADRRRESRHDVEALA